METSTAPGTDALHPAATTADPEAAAGGAHRGAAGVAADDFDFDSYNDAALVRALKDLEKKNSFFELENRLFHSYLNRVAPHALKGEDEADEKAAAAAAPGGTGASAPGVRHAEKEGRAKKKRGDKSKEQEKPVFLTTDQKSEVATRELEELRDEIEKQKADWEKIMDNLKAELEEIELRNGEIRKAMYEFRRDIVQQAVNPRTGKIMAERVVRYYEDTIRAKDATVEKIRLKNTALKVHKNKLALQLKQKEEMGEVLHAIDFDQLTIENQNYQMKIEERNKELLKLKLTAANTVQILNHYKKRLPLLTAESEKLKSDIAARRQLLVKLGEESVVARTERAIAAEANRRVKERIGEFRVPSVMDYVVQKAKREEAFRRLASWERKVEIAEMALARARRTWKQISRECNMQLAVAAAIASPPHRLGPLHGRASDNLPEARRTVSFAPAVSRHVHTSPAQDTAPLGLEAVF